MLLSHGIKNRLSRVFKLPACSLCYQPLLGYSQSKACNGFATEAYVVCAYISRSKRTKFWFL